MGLVGVCVSYEEWCLHQPLCPKCDVMEKNQGNEIKNWCMVQKVL